MNDSEQSIRSRRIKDAVFRIDTFIKNQNLTIETKLYMLHDELDHISQIAEEISIAASQEKK